MGISPTHFNYYLSKQPIKGIYLVVKVGCIDVTPDYEINKSSINPKSFAVCVTRKIQVYLTSLHILQKQQNF